MPGDQRRDCFMRSRAVSPCRARASRFAFLDEAQLPDCLVAPEIRLSISILRETLGQTYYPSTPIASTCLVMAGVLRSSRPRLTSSPFLQKGDCPFSRLLYLATAMLLSESAITRPEWNILLSHTSGQMG